MDVTQLTAILDIAQAGGTAILLALLYTLWKAYEKQNEFIREMLLQSQAERQVIANRLGMSGGELQSKAEAVRRNGNSP